jgi:hypothetical protein
MHLSRLQSDPASVLGMEKDIGRQLRPPWNNEKAEALLDRKEFHQPQFDGHATTPCTHARRGTLGRVRPSRQMNHPKQREHGQHGGIPAEHGSAAHRAGPLFTNAVECS